MEEDNLINFGFVQIDHCIISQIENNSEDFLFLGLST